MLIYSTLSLAENEKYCLKINSKFYVKENNTFTHLKVKQGANRLHTHRYMWYSKMWLSKAYYAFLIAD